MKKSRFIKVMVAIMLLMITLTGCTKDNVNVGLSYTEKFVTIYTDQECALDLTIKIKDGENTDTILKTFNLKGDRIRNLSIEDLISSTPIVRITKARIRAETYSILPCPNGWSLSAGLPEILNPARLITDETASKILFAPSATIETLRGIVPKIILNTERITLRMIPTTPLRMP